MTVPISLDIQVVIDDASAQRKLIALYEALSDENIATWLHTEASEWIKQRATARFSSEGDDVTGPWEALSDATVHIRESLGFPGEHPINNRTGELESFILDSDGDIAPTGAGVTMTYPGDQMNIEVALKLAGAQGGTSKAPPRPVLGLDETDAFAIMQSLTEHLFITSGGSAEELF